MPAAVASSACTYEPPLWDNQPGPACGPGHVAHGGTLPHTILIKNVLWFCQLRWIVIGILTGYGCLLLAGDTVRAIGLRPPGGWPFAVAALLSAGNIGFLIHASGMKKQTDVGRSGAVSLWVQILFDLVLLTAVIHFLGSSETFFPFAYLFHIGLACIFFPRAWSFCVTMIASALYSLAVTLVATGVLPHSSIYVNDPLYSGAIETVNLISAVLIWVVVWYLMSHLSASVRARDAELARANQRLLEAQEERATHMLQTTHELKAPFAAIHANTQLLLKGHCGLLSDQALDVVLRISARSRRLAREIQDMLQLANLNAPSQKPYPRPRIDLVKLLDRSLEQVKPLAEEKNVSIQFDRTAEPLWVTGAEDHLKMMFDNLLANAVMYSFPNGAVRIACTNNGKEGIQVAVEDNGIGIPRDKLPRIFDEYYRTNEAVRHWKESTGLGLAIVKQVAAAHHMRIRVCSEESKGTTVVLNIPYTEAPGTNRAAPRDTHRRART